MDCPPSLERGLGCFATESRLSLWKQLLGVDSDDVRADFESATEECTRANSKRRVIHQDVLRTRADEDFFKSLFVRAVMRQTLIRFCSHRSIEYMQGLNEILAPCLYLQANLLPAHLAYQPDSPQDSLDSLEVSSVEVRAADAGGTGDTGDKAGDSGDTGDTTGETSDALSPMYSADDPSCNGSQCNIPHPFHLSMVLFERIMARFSPTLFSTKGVNALQVQLTAFHLLLTYHEPLLATILRKEGMTPDMYAMPWLITLFVRRQPISCALHCWDVLLRRSSPEILVFAAVALVQSRRRRLLGDAADLPAVLVSMKIESHAEIDAVFEAADGLMRSTPASLREELVCCGFDTRTSEADREAGLRRFWHRPCVMTQASEVAAVLLNRNGQTGGLPMLVLDCRRLSGTTTHIEGTVSVPAAVQEEVCALACRKSALLDRDDSDMGFFIEPWDIERSFSKSLSQLSTRSASVLSLLWAAFVTGSRECTHFVLVDDTLPMPITSACIAPLSQAQLAASSRSAIHIASVGSDESHLRCSNHQGSGSQESPLQTSYALPYHTSGNMDEPRSDAGTGTGTGADAGAGTGDEQTVLITTEQQAQAQVGMAGVGASAGSLEGSGSGGGGGVGGGGSGSNIGPGYASQIFRTDDSGGMRGSGSGASGAGAVGSGSEEGKGDTDKPDYNLADLAAALIILGFPRVSLVPAEKLDTHAFYDEAQAYGEFGSYCSSGHNSYSMPVLAPRSRSSFDAVLHHLHLHSQARHAMQAQLQALASSDSFSPSIPGVEASLPPLRLPQRPLPSLPSSLPVLPGQRRFIRTPTCHYLEYQVAAFVHELRCTAIDYKAIDLDFYSHGGQASDIIRPPSAPILAPPLPAAGSISAGALASGGADGVIGASEEAGAADVSHSGFVSGNASTADLDVGVGMSMGVGGADGGGPGPSSIMRFAAHTLRSPTPAQAQGIGQLCSPSMEFGNMGAALMAAKCALSLDPLYQLLSIMSAQKKEHIACLVLERLYHGSLPSVQASLNPNSPSGPSSARGSGSASASATASSNRGNSDDQHPRLPDRENTLGPAPPPSNYNFPYFRRLDSLLNLRDTLQEVVTTQRLNRVLESTAGQLLNRLKLLRNSVENTGRRTARTVGRLRERTSLRRTGAWQTTADLHDYFPGDRDDQSEEEGAYPGALEGY